MKLKPALLLFISCLTMQTFCATHSKKTDDVTFTDFNHGIVSFDISMPIDYTGQRLQGKNLTGGIIKYTDKWHRVTPFLALEQGNFQLPTSKSATGKPYIKTRVKYSAIKFINPIGLGNFFIKIGIASRFQKLTRVDQFALKDGTYTWQVPIFATGREKNTVNNQTKNMQFLQVGSAPSGQNAIYSKDFFIYTQGKNQKSIIGHPVSSSRSQAILKKPYTTHFACVAHGIWGENADPYRKTSGHCTGRIHTFPAGPNMDYEYGTFILPTVLSPWKGPKHSHCIIKGKRKSGCINIKIATSIHFIAQKIRIPIDKHVSLYAESGTLYNRITPSNLIYDCKSNTYLKKILPKKDCGKKSYLPGGWSSAYFGVGYTYTTNSGTHYEARYIYTPEKENANRLTWLDASDTQIYAINITKKGNLPKNEYQIIHALKKGLSIIKKHPAIYKILGKNYFNTILNQKYFKKQR